MSKSNNFLYTSAGLLLVLAALLAVVFLSNSLFKGVRLDLTEDQLYTMSQGTKNILRDIDEPVNLYFFFSDSTSGEATGIRSYATRVREVLEEFEQHANGKLRLRVIDPVPFSEEEDQAAEFGIQPVPIGPAGETLYFGLAGTNSVDEIALIPFFQPDKETFLEYDLAKLVDSLANPERQVVGLMSSLKMTGGFNPQTFQPTPGWAIAEQLEQLFEVRPVATTATEIDADVDVLMVVHPKNMSDEALYAIDQFVLRGGRALIFVDPYADADLPEPDPENPAGQFTPRSSTLGKLFSAWGVNFDVSQFVVDDALALAVRGGPAQRDTRHLGLLGFAGDALDSTDIVTGALDSVNAGFVGHFTFNDKDGVSVLPLLQSSVEAGLSDAQQLLFQPDPEALRSGFAPDGQRHVVAARLAGRFDSAFPDGPPTSVPDAAPDEAVGSGHLTASSAETNLILVADVDLLTDRFWVQVQQFFGQRLLNAFANNGDFVFNALDNLAGNVDLISIRGRATSQRPFTRVQELQRRAEEQFRSTEQRLEEELAATEQRLGELQANREDGNALILSDEQRAEIENFNQQRVRIRKELRQVRRNLDKDIERLGVQHQLLNMLAVPVVLVVFAIYRGMRRRRRAEAAQETR